MATDDPAGGPSSGQPPQADASPRAETPAQDEALREVGGRARRRPPTVIDLAAKDLTPPEATPPEAPSPEVTAPEAPSENGAGEPPHADAASGTDTAPEATEPPPAAPPKAKGSLGFLAGLIIALLSGLVGGAIATMVALSFFGATDSLDSLTDLEARTVELRQRTDALEARPQAADGSAAVAALGQRLDTLTATLDGVQGKVTALESAPAPQSAAQASASEVPAAVSPELNARLDAVEALAKRASEATAAPSPELTARLDAVEALVKRASEASAAPSPELTARLDAVEALAKQASTTASTAAERPTVSPDAVTALGDKLTALEQRVADVAKANETAARGAAQLAALGALREAVLRGSPFAAELAAARNLLGAQADALQPLDAYAAGGFPSGPALLKRLTTKVEAPAAAAAPAAEQPAAPAPANEGFFTRLSRSAEGLVSVRRVEQADPASTSEAEAASARVAAALLRDDMAGAAQEIAALPAGARDAAQPVLADIAARQKALADIDTLNRQILAQLAGSAP